MKKIVTHPAGFHVDDIVAVAILKILLKEDVEIIRTRDMAVIQEADFVVDVGSIHDPSINRFDHHQEGGAGMRENGIPYAACGLVWKTYGKDICESEEKANFIDEKFIQSIDAIDNGIDVAQPLRNDISIHSIHTIVNMFEPTWKEDKSDAELYARFIQLVEVAELYLRRLIYTTSDYLEGKQILIDAYRKATDKRLIIINEHCPFQEVLNSFPEALYVIYPRIDGSWGLKAVKQDIRSFKNRKDLPEVWAGKRDQELQAITGVSDAVFCHNKRFLAVSKSKEGALELAHLALTA